MALSLLPAYGRDYKSKAEVLADWFADKDFIATGYGSGGYINRPQVTCDVHIRYKGATQVCVIPFGMKPPVPKSNPERKRIKRDGIETVAEVYRSQAHEANKLAKPRATLRSSFDYEREEAPENYDGTI